MNTAAVNAPGAPSAKAEASSRPRFIRKFSEITINDVPLVGGKTASLGEMFRELSSQNVQVPDGFAITAEAYRNFLSTGGICSSAAAVPC